MSEVTVNYSGANKPPVKAAIVDGLAQNSTSVSDTNSPRAAMIGFGMAALLSLPLWVLGVYFLRRLF